MTTNNLKLALTLLLIIQTLSQTETSSTDTSTTPNLISVSQRWGFGFLAGLGVSALGFITALMIVWCKNTASDACFEMTIKFLFSLAFGALIGDAMIHLLPDGYSAPGVDFRATSGIFIGSIVFFIILERVFAACGITHQHWHGAECHDDHEGAIHNHDHPRKVANEDLSQSQLENNMNSKKEKSIVAVESQSAIDDNINKSHQHNCKNHDHKHENTIEETSNGIEKSDNKSCWENLKGKGTSGYMNLLGSLIHNFMDGLALGVAFATGDEAVFVPLLVAIIAHEIPREMGDVAILMTNEFTSTQTILCNGFVNLTSLLGVFIGLAITDLNDETKTYILVFVAGNFMFIAADIWKHLFKNQGIIKNFIEFIGFGVGVAAMYCILLLETSAG